MNLEVFALRLTRAEEELLDEVRRIYPVGVRVKVRLQRNHTTPTNVEVIGHLPACGGGKHRGCLRVRLLDEWGHETSVPWHAVLKT